MNDPWLTISKPAGVTANARRADEKHPFDYFWAVDVDGHCLFIYEYDKPLKLGENKPRLNGISIIDYEPESGDKKN